eukprot:CAMPEP_0203876930 /NCGR_PEP_ID=MMETSP0359-20131031/21613_1 /ASSEMBLY_ACC=CAM_ASM_000338 /TAXON_ID=268821 /ORGANISM="Scrippsiella Hangoei, Strain SHTV-5" /LENGTH=43 /DNA_ID= /DNA_START= /DNA_END= /DNA_ORIENTATION=
MPKKGAKKADAAPEPEVEEPEEAAEGGSDDSDTDEDMPNLENA